MAPEQQPKRDYRKEVTEEIIRMLEAGTAPWQKPWRAGALEMPQNPTSGKAYRGGNAVHLLSVATLRGYDDPRWLTYKQAQEQGWQVRKGERGTQIEYWEFPKQARSKQAGSERLEGSEDRDAKEDRRLIHRVYTVFNASQVEGMPAHVPRQRPDFEVVASGEQVLQHSGARILHDQNDRAFYSRQRDSIHLPPQAAFRSAADYYGTALHELAHWTGHPARLNRETLNDNYQFGDTNYAKEELRAELASVFLAAERGIPHNPAQHAAYVDSWIKSLRDDKNEIFRAAKEANRAADFVLSLEQQKANEVEVRQETSEFVAEFDRGTRSVVLQQKATATNARVPTEQDRGSADQTAEPRREAEAVLDNQVRQFTPERQALKSSFSAAQDLSRELLGPDARTFAAQTDSGIYRGRVIGETDFHIVQQLGQQSAVAHMKHLLAAAPSCGIGVVVAYGHQGARVTELVERARTRAVDR
jgi:antirestriction protein ArdC